LTATYEPTIGCNESDTVCPCVSANLLAPPPLDVPAMCKIEVSALRHEPWNQGKLSTQKAPLGLRNIRVSDLWRWHYFLSSIHPPELSAL